MSSALPEPWPGDVAPVRPKPTVGFPRAPLALAVPAGDEDMAARLIAAFQPIGPCLVLLFGTPALGLPQLGRELGAALGPACRIVGCSSAGEIGPQGYCKESVVALAFPAESFRAGICILRDQAQVPVSDWMAKLRRFHAGFRPDPRRSSFGILLPDALARQEDVLVATLDAAIPGLPVIGGSAAEGMRFLPTCQMVDGEAHPGAAVFMLIETDLAVAEVSFAHFRPTDRRAVVTAADPHNRIIWELNAEPAAQEYARLTGIALNALTTTEFARHPLLLRTGRRHHVRAIRAMTPDGGLQLLSGIEAGNILTLGHAVDMTQGFADAMDALPRPPLMVLGFDCILRRIALERAGMTERMSELLARYRVVGFNTYGEQHSGMHVNQTFVGMALMPPEVG
ncbi:FIST N-terminal domain-containing protein [Paracoccus sp. CPCC 101403]|uniref:FIST N-terminal domain-containing protein n=1 Tax=Paracoccus broussonetiae TaxID=3075834 RepID=A0ABU3EG30_9RHOB|nr:FIST N-terminal domain-containing protein [Paracoccus sp. CPCC 101403]MDT1063198.1 FIST N-terminal domain-containing protein [Paracoccus sp. CPCC 101403]